MMVNRHAMHGCMQKEQLAKDHMHCMLVEHTCMYWNKEDHHYLSMMQA
jgi:hypothetical protein